MSMRGNQGKGFGEQFGKSAEIKTVHSYDLVIQTSSIYGGDKQP